MLAAMEKGGKAAWRVKEQDSFMECAVRANIIHSTHSHYKDTFLSNVLDARYASVKIILSFEHQNRSMLFGTPIPSSVCSITSNFFLSFFEMLKAL